MSTREDRRYARFYYPEFIRDYRVIYDDDAAFATWHRLLVVAEQMWPMAPDLPRSVRARPLRALVDAGLVCVTGTSFEIKGHAAERARRSGIARNAADVRWQNERNADAHADAMPSTSTSKDETTPPPSRAKGRMNGTNARATGSNPRAKGTSPRQIREGYKTGPTALGAVMREIEGLER